MRGPTCSLFFYGTLMDRNLLSQVVGRRIWPRALRPAMVRGWRRRAVCGASYPVALRERGASIKGVVLAGVTRVECALLSEFEGNRYELVPALAQLPAEPLGRVFFFRPKRGAFTLASGPWSLASWRLRHRASVVHALTAAKGGARGGSG